MVFFSLSFSLLAQYSEISLDQLDVTVSERVRIRMDSGASFQGDLYFINEEFVQLIDKDGQVITLLRDLIEKTWALDQNKDEKSFYLDSASNRLLVIPTGFPMETGEFHIADQEIAAVTMSYGVNEHFSLWGGVSIPGALVSARFIMDLGEKAALSLGSFAGVSWLEFTGLLIPYAVFSLGAPENNFTAAAGVVFGFGEDGFGFDAAVLVLGGKWVVSSTTAIVLENWFIWGEMTDVFDLVTFETRTAWDPMPIFMVPGAAFRIAGEKFSWDIGAVLPILIEKEEGVYQVEGLAGEWGFIPVPLISLTYRID